MYDHDALSADLPPPRDDEPASLRQDILDELADHLGCAYNRELLRGANSGPAAVARRLWFDAMKGKIMAQRVMIATCLVVTLASLSLAGVFWQQSVHVQRESARAAAEAVRALKIQSDQAQASQQEMLKQLHEMSDTIRSTRSLDWNPVTFKLTEETLEGSPAAGVLITFGEHPRHIVGGMSGQVETSWSWRVTDRSGMADFGVVHPGDYAFQIFKSWDQGSLATSGEFSIEPGSQITRRIVCPRTPPERVPVRLRWEWPADLEKEKLAIYATFTLKPIQRDGLTWALSDDRAPDPSEQGRFRSLLNMNMAWRWGMTRSVLCGPSTSLAQVLNKTPSFWTLPGQLRGPSAEKQWMDLLRRDLRELKGAAEAVEWERGSYGLSALFVMHPGEPADGKTGLKRFEIVLPIQFGMGIPQSCQLMDSPPTYDDPNGPKPKAARKIGRGGGGNGFGGGNGNYARVPLNMEIPMAAWSNIGRNFEARPGQVNEWTIPLRDELIEAVRAKLKAAKSRSPAREDLE
jgi:hypothetical protein